MLEYQARKWTCAISGKGKLTYEEAQLSEKNAKNVVDSSFPEIFLEPLCRMVHMSQRRMDELIDAIFKRLSCFRNDEDLEGVQGDGREPLRVRIVRPVEVDEDFFLDVDPEAAVPTRYIVTAGSKKKTRKDLDKSGSCSENGGDDSSGEGDGDDELEEMEVSGNDLRRPKGRSVSRMTIKSKLKTIGSREAYWQAPFLCEDEIVQKFGMQSELPPHIRRLKLQNDVKTGKLKKEELAVLDPALAEERAKKRRRKSGEKDENDPQRLAKSVLKTSLQKKMWDATTASVKKSFEVGGEEEWLR